MVLVAGIAASVLIQTMNSLEEQAMRTGLDTMREVSSGLKVTQISGYVTGSKITQMAIFITPIAASEYIDLSSTYISLSDSNTKVILNYTNTVFSATVSNGLFSTLNAALLTSSTYGVLVIRDTDGSCTASNPVINSGDTVALLVNASKCFSGGIDIRTQVFGSVNPEYGISGFIKFTTPHAFPTAIVELQN